MTEQRVRAKRILVVDDDRDYADTLANLLTGDGFEVEAAYDAMSALGKLYEFRPEFGVLDIGLPHMDGYELAALIRKSSSNTILIAMTGWTDEEHRMAALRAGFAFHLGKPFRFEELKAILTPEWNELLALRLHLKFRYHPLMRRRSGAKAWPPLWINVRGATYPKPSGEIGFLTRVEEHPAISACLFLWVIHEGETYVGTMNFDDSGFCREIRRVLDKSIGLNLRDIGDIDLSHLL